MQYSGSGEAKRYRELAEKLRLEARIVSEPAGKRHLQELANYYERLAREAADRQEKK
jgi:hypothetical protein